MLKNRFRKLVGILLVAVFGVAVFQYFRQTAGNQYVVAAFSSGLWLLVFLAVIIGLAWTVDRRKRQRGD